LPVKEETEPGSLAEDSTVLLQKGKSVHGQEDSGLHPFLEVDNLLNE